MTTVLGGNCGFSIAPLGPGDAGYIRAMMAVVEGIPLEALEGGGPWSWGTFAEYLDRVDGGLAVNAGFLVGHSTVRRVVMGERATYDEATPAQLDAMVRLVGQSLDGGALGLSSSLGEGHLDGDHRPVPSSSASFAEFVALAGELRHHPGTTLEFIPTIGPIPQERMELMADMSLAADRPLNWNLLGSLSSEEIWEQQLRASDVAAARGAHVVALALPDMMRMRSNTLLPGLPGWREVMALDADGRRAAAADPDTRAALRAGAERVAGRAIGVLTDFAMMEVADPGSGVGGPFARGDRRRAGHRRDRRADRRGAPRRAHPVRRPPLVDTRASAAATRAGRPGWRCGRTPGWCSGAPMPAPTSTSCAMPTTRHGCWARWSATVGC